MSRFAKFLDAVLQVQASRRKRDDKIHRTMSEFSRSLTLIIDLDQLKRNVVSVISELVDVEKLLIFLLDLDLDRLQLVEGGRERNSGVRTSLFRHRRPAGPVVFAE